VTDDDVEARCENDYLVRFITIGNDSDHEHEKSSTKMKTLTIGGHVVVAKHDATNGIRDLSWSV
jgi:hypothetical protein